MTNTDLRTQAEQKLEAYRATQEWAVVRQVVLRCIYAIWSEQFDAARIAALSDPLVGQPVELAAAQVELTRMVRAKLLRRNLGKYELSI